MQDQKSKMQLYLLLVLWFEFGWAWGGPIGPRGQKQGRLDPVDPVCIIGEVGGGSRRLQDQKSKFIILATSILD